MAESAESDERRELDDLNGALPPSKNNPGLEEAIDRLGEGVGAATLELPSPLDQTAFNRHLPEHWRHRRSRYN